MKVSFTKQEAIEALRAHYNFSSDVEIDINDVEPLHNEWCEVPSNWRTNFAPLTQIQRFA